MDNLDAHNRQTGEPFPNWPSVEEYRKEQSEAVRTQKDSVKRLLTEHGYPNDVLEPMAIVMIKTVFAYEFMSKNTNLDRKIETSTTWAQNLHKQTRGTAAFEFMVSGKTVNDFSELKTAATNNLSDISLSKVQIALNINELYNRFVSNNRMLGMHKKAYPTELVSRKDYWSEGVRIQSLEYEKCVVEEVAHSLYLASIMKQPSKLLEFIDEAETYKSHEPSDDNLIPIYSEEEMKSHEENYTNKPIEQKAAILVEQFMKKYHPEETKKTGSL